MYRLFQGKFDVGNVVFGYYQFIDDRGYRHFDRSHHEDAIDSFWGLLGLINVKDAKLVLELVSRKIPFRVRVTPYTEMKFGPCRVGGQTGWFDDALYEIVIPDEDDALMFKLMWCEND